MKNTTGETIKSELPLPRKKQKKRERGATPVSNLGDRPMGRGVVWFHRLFTFYFNSIKNSVGSLHLPCLHFLFFLLVFLCRFCFLLVMFQLARQTSTPLVPYSAATTVPFCCTKHWISFCGWTPRIHHRSKFVAIGKLYVVVDIVQL